MPAPGEEEVVAGVMGETARDGALNLAAFLASDRARYITGQQIRVDAGSLLKFPNGPS